jgi:uncharacterized protein
LKLHLADTEGRNAITGYGEGFVMVSRARYERSLVVMPDKLIVDWGGDSGQALNQDSMAFLATLGAEIVIIGTGHTLLFPPMEMLRPLIDAGVGFELMDTRAACRTYNILLAEDRKVAAALII